MSRPERLTSARLAQRACRDHASVSTRAPRSSATFPTTEGCGLLGLAELLETVELLGEVHADRWRLSGSNAFMMPLGCMSNSPFRLLDLPTSVNYIRPTMVMGLPVTSKVSWWGRYRVF
jgi:hypothetical protein